MIIDFLLTDRKGFFFYDKLRFLFFYISLLFSGACTKLCFSGPFSFNLKIYLIKILLLLFNYCFCQVNTF